MSTTECQGFAQKLLNYNISEGKYYLAQGGEGCCVLSTLPFQDVSDMKNWV